MTKADVKQHTQEELTNPQTCGKPHPQRHRDDDDEDGRCDDDDEDCDDDGDDTLVRA